MEYMAKNIDVDDKDNLKEEFNKAYVGYRWIDVLIYMSPEGRILYSKPHNDIIYKRNYKDRDYYNYVMSKKDAYISEVFIGSIVKQPHIMIAVPIIDPKTKEVKAILGGGVPLSAIENIVKKAYKVYDGDIYVIDSDTKVIVSPNNERYLYRKVNVEGKKIQLEELIKKYEFGTGVYKKGFSNIYMSFMKIKNYDGMIIVEKNEQAIIDEISIIKSKFSSYILIILSFILVLSISLANSIVRPIKDLIKYTRRISENAPNEVLDTMDMKLDKKNDEIKEFQISFRDMAIELNERMQDLKNMHKREHDLRKYLNNILKSAGSGVIAINDEKRIVIFNKAAEKLTGIRSKDIVGAPVDCLIEQVYGFESIGNLKSKDSIEKEITIKGLNKNETPIDMIISPVLDKEEGHVSVVCIMRDLTKIKNLEKELKIKDRLETMGQLSSAIIHEIGNPLAGMTNLLEVLRDNMEDEETREDIITALNDEVDILNNMVINFLDYTKISKHEQVKINIYHIINSSINILRPQIKYKMIRIIEEINPNIPKIKLDPVGMRQVFVNILKNAIQAVGEYGIIHIKVSVFGNKDVEVSIRDNGKGISKDSIDKIFNPLFTTKEDGNGLGLYVVHNIVLENRGSIIVESEKGEYTDFIITFKGE